MFSCGRSSSFSVYSRFLIFFSCSGAVRGLFLTSLGGGRLALDLEDLLTPEEVAERGDFLLLPLPLSPPDLLPLEEPRFGAIVCVWSGGDVRFVKVRWLWPAVVVKFSAARD